MRVLRGMDPMFGKYVICGEIADSIISSNAKRALSGQKYLFVRYDNVLHSRASFQAGIERELPPALQCGSSHGQVAALEIEVVT